MARPRRRLGNLPAEATTFIGRRGELADLRSKLGQARLVTLVGPGGVGKTRLAIRAAGDLGRGFRAGAWLVELGEVRDPALVPNAAVAALDLRDQAAAAPLELVLAYLRDVELLLVVDNCEHVLAEAAQLVSEALGRAPGVRILATSREPLSVSGEQVVPVPPLELPPLDGAGPLARLRQNEAVLLFTERAAQASGSFDLTESNRAAVVDLCRRLDGVPLAIELAAVRTRVLTPEQILDRLSDRFGLLTGGSRAALPRHQTLRTTIDWSHDLLEPAERALLRRLSVFASRFTIEDVESVCEADGRSGPGVFDLLSSLVDKSLVTKQEAGRLACYRLHETMREYAVLELRRVGEVDAFELRAAEYYRARCRRSMAQSRFELLEWLEWVELEIDNVRAVLRGCLDRDDRTRGIDLVISLSWYWLTRATTEGVRWLDQLLASGDEDPAPRARACFLRGFLAVLQSDSEAAEAALELAAVAAGEAGQRHVLSQSLSMASIAASMAGDHTAARRLLNEAVTAADGLDDQLTTLMRLQARAYIGLFQGDLEAVRAASSEGARLSREFSHLYTLENMLLNLGTASLVAGDLEESRALLGEALRIARDIDDRYASYCLLDALGCQAAARGQARRAAQLLGAAETVRTGIGANVVPFLAPLLARAEESALGGLGPARFEAEFAAGRGMDRAAAIQLALGEPARVAGPAAGGRDTGSLGRREAEVAQLVAQGLTNKQIGSRLFISEHTVDSHVRSIMNKLGCNSRAQIAAWAASPEP